MKVYNNQTQKRLLFSNLRLRWRRLMEDGPERPKWLPPATVAEGRAAIGGLALRVPPPPSSTVEVVMGVGFSTGFLERFRPRCTWRSQYFWPATTSLEHRHFLPSVLRQRPGSGSMAARPQYPDCNTDTARSNSCHVTERQCLYIHTNLHGPSAVER